MHATGWSIGILAAMLALLAACAPKPLVHSTRLAPTGIRDDTSIGVMVLYHERCAEHRAKTGTNCAPGEVTARINSQYSRCVGSAFRDSSHRVTILPGEAFHEKFLALAEPEYSELTPDRTMELLSRPEISAALRQDGVGYVILLSSTTTDSDRQAMLDFDQGVWAFGAESRRTTLVEALVFSSAAAASAGNLRLGIQGDAGWLMPVFVIIPLPPIPYGSRTESKSCKAIGRGIAEFLASEELPNGDPLNGDRPETAPAPQRSSQRRAPD